MNKISPYYYFNIYLSDLYKPNKNIGCTDYSNNEELICFKAYDKKGNKEIKYKNVIGLHIDVII